MKNDIVENWKYSKWSISIWDKLGILSIMMWKWSAFYDLVIGRMFLFRTFWRVTNWYLVYFWEILSMSVSRGDFWDSKPLSVITKLISRDIIKIFENQTKKCRKIKKKIHGYASDSQLGFISAQGHRKSWQNSTIWYSRIIDDVLAIFLSFSCLFCS